jgi:large conductance mechanosensitive channel
MGYSALRRESHRADWLASGSYRGQSWGRAFRSWAGGAGSGRQRASRRHRSERAPAAAGKGSFDMLEEFKKFAMRGNVIDLAVGIIIGAAFTAIVNSLVNDVLMPPRGLAIGGIDFSDFFITMKGAGGYATLEQAKAAGAVTLNYGLFFNSIIKFLIVAFAVFLLVKQINRLQTKEEAKPPAVAEIPREQVLLSEIRDILKTRS